MFPTHGSRKTIYPKKSAHGIKLVFFEFLCHTVIDSNVLFWSKISYFPIEISRKTKKKFFFFKEKIGILKYEQSDCFKLAIFRVRNGFYLVFCRNRDWNGVFLMFLTIFFELFLVGKVMKENHIRKVQNSEKRKQKNHH